MWITRRRLGTLLGATAAGGLAGGLGGATRAFAKDDAPSLPNVFISPHGQPFRALEGAAYPVAAWFAQADKNGDGRIDRDEFMADAEAFFAVLDLRGGGVLDAHAIAFYENSIAPEVLGRRVTVLAQGRPRLWLAQYGTAGDQPSYGPGGLNMPQSQAGGLYGGANAPGGEKPMGPGDAGSGVLPKDARPDEPDEAPPPKTLGQGAQPYGLLNEAEPVTNADPDYVVNSMVRKEAFLDHARKNFAALDTAGTGLTLGALPPTPIQKYLSEGNLKRADRS